MKEVEFFFLALPFFSLSLSDFLLKNNRTKLNEDLANGKKWIHFVWSEKKKIKTKMKNERLPLAPGTCVWNSPQWPDSKAFT